MTLSADEMELYSKVIRQFRIVFLKQEHMNTFKTYDSLDTNVSRSTFCDRVISHGVYFYPRLLLFKDKLLVICF